MTNLFAPKWGAILFIYFTLFTFASPSLSATLQPNTGMRTAHLQHIHIGNPVNAVAWSLDGSKLATLSEFGKDVNIYDGRNLQKIESFSVLTSGYSGNSTAFLLNGSLITAAKAVYEGNNAHDALYQWDISTGKIIRSLPTSVGVDVAVSLVKHTNTFVVSHTGHLIAAIDATNRSGIYIIDSSSGALIRIINLPLPNRRFDARSISFSPDDNFIAVGMAKGNIYVFDINTGRLDREFNQGANSEYSISAIAYSSDGQLIATGRSKNINLPHDTLTSINIIDSRSGKSVFDLPGLTMQEGPVRETGHVWQLSWSNHGRLLAVADQLSLRVWNIEVGKPSLLLSNETPGGFFCVQFSPDGRLAAGHNSDVDILTF